MLLDGYNDLHQYAASVETQWPGTLKPTFRKTGWDCYSISGLWVPALLSLGDEPKECALWKIFVAAHY
jgi:hypothetical protein